MFSLPRIQKYDSRPRERRRRSFARVSLVDRVPDVRSSDERLSARARTLFFFFFFFFSFLSLPLIIHSRRARGTKVTNGKFARARIRAFNSGIRDSRSRRTADVHRVRSFSKYNFRHVENKRLVRAHDTSERDVASSRSRERHIAKGRWSPRPQARRHFCRSIVARR